MNRSFQSGRDRWAAALFALLVAAHAGHAQREVAALAIGEAGSTSSTRVAISPDGKQVAAVVSGDGNEVEKDYHVRIWDLKSRKEATRLHPGAPLYGRLFAFTPDGKQLVCSSRTEVYVYDLKAPRRRPRKFKPASVSPDLAVLTADGKTVVCAGEKVAAYDLASGKELWVIKPPRRVYRLAVSRDGKKVAGSHRNGQVSLWDAPRQKLVRTFDSKAGIGAGEIAFSPDGKRLVATGSLGHMILWDLEADKVEASFAFLKQAKFVFSPKAVAFTPDGKRVVTTGRGGVAVPVFVWEPGTGKLLGDRTEGRSLEVCLALSKDGKTLVTAYKKVKVFDLSGEAKAEP